MNEIDNMENQYNLNINSSNRINKRNSVSLKNGKRKSVKVRILEDNKNEDEQTEEMKIIINNPKKKKKKKKKKKVKKKLKRLEKKIVENSIEKDFNLDKIGLIKYAIQHRSASRPMRKLNEFNNKTEFCPCCSLPVEQKGIIEKYNACDDPGKFAECGQGTALYFSFMKFSIYMTMISCFIFFYFILSNYKNYHQVKDFCENYFSDENNNITEIIDICSFYVSKSDSNTVLLKNNFVSQFNVIILKDYKDLIYLVNSGKIEKFNDTSMNSSLLNFIGLISLFFINLLYIILQSNENNKADMDVVSPSDYSIYLYNLEDSFHYFLSLKEKYNNELIEKENNIGDCDTNKKDGLHKFRTEIGIPDEKNNDELTLLDEFKYFIKNMICMGENEKYNIKQINICFKLDQLMEYEEELQQKKTIIDKVLNHPEQIKKNQELMLEGDQRKYFCKKCLCCTEEIELSELKEEKKKIQKKIESLFEKTQKITEENFAGTAFVTFSSIKEQEIFMEQYPKNNIINIINFLKLTIFKCCNNSRDISWLKKNINCEIAPEPEDILFENLQYSSIQRLNKTIIGFFFCLIFVGVDYCFAYLLDILQKRIDEKKNFSSILGYVISLCFTAISSCTNLMFSSLLDKTSKSEKQATLTNYYLSYSAKLCIFTFLTSAIVPLISELQNQSENHKVLLSNMLMMFIVNSFVTPFLWTFDISYYLKQIQIFIIENRDDPDTKHDKTQRELNKLYELPKMDISYKYSYIGKTLLMTFFYIPIFPIGILITVLGFIFGYFLEKYNFANRYKRPEMLNSQICQFYVNYFVLNFFAYGVSDYIFMSELYDTELWSLVNIIFFGILIIIPYNQIFSCDCIGLNESEINRMGFDDVYFQFYNDYERSNPFTKKEGINNYLLKLKEKGDINERQYNKLKKNMDKVNLLELYYENKKSQINVQRGLIKKKKKNKNRRSVIKVRRSSIASNNLINMQKSANEEVKDNENGNDIMEMYNKNAFMMNFGVSIQSAIKSFINENKDDNTDLGGSEINKTKKEQNAVNDIESLIINKVEDEK